MLAICVARPGPHPCAAPEYASLKVLLGSPYCSRALLPSAGAASGAQASAMASRMRRRCIMASAAAVCAVAAAADDECCVCVDSDRFSVPPVLASRTPNTAHAHHTVVAMHPLRMPGGHLEGQPSYRRPRTGPAIRKAAPRPPIAAHHAFASTLRWPVPPDAPAPCSWPMLLQQRRPVHPQHAVATRCQLASLGAAMQRPVYALLR